MGDTPPIPSEQAEGGRWREDADGILRRYNAEGFVIEEQKQKDGPRRRFRTGRPPMTDDQRALLEAQSKQIDRTVWTAELEETICDLYRDGVSLKKIELIPGMPSRRSILRRRERYPEFAAQLKSAASSTSLIHYDDYLELMERLLNEDVHEDDVAALRLLRDMKKDALKWADRETFGDHTKLSGDPNAPLTFILDTGIRRDGDDAISVESKPVLADTPEAPSA